LNTTHRKKLNASDAILGMVQFPIASTLQEIWGNSPILILENVRNDESIGSILRTAFCLSIWLIAASKTAWAILKDS
jgi:tRNA G18 (ribose-2'-O)-methylase SpoU